MKRPPKIEPKSALKPKKKRVQLGATAHVIRFLDRWYTMARNSRRRRGEWMGMLAFVRAHQAPFKERGDRYLQILNDILDAAPGDLTDPTMGTTEWSEVPGKIKLMSRHLHDLRTDRLNYDDMREALDKLHTTPAWRYLWPSSKRKILESSGASKALIGAPVSDAGEMRRALQLVDNSLTAAVKRIDSEKPAPPDALMEIWAAIHGARKALKAVQPSNSVRFEDLPEEKFREAYDNLRAIASARYCGKCDLDYEEECTCGSYALEEALELKEPGKQEA